MYFINNELKEFKIAQLKRYQHYNNKRQYSFLCEIKDFPEVETIGCIFFENNKKTYIHFHFFLKEEAKKTNTYKRISIQRILKVCMKKETLNFFFQKNKRINIKQEITFDPLEPDFKVALSGEFKFNIKKESLFSLLYSFEPVIASLKNENTINYLIEKESVIMNEFDFNKNKHSILKELINAFDINSEDFFNALKLHYDF